MKQDRMAKVNRLMQTTLAGMVPSLVRDPRVSDLPFIAVTAVRTTQDLRYAKVFLSIPVSKVERDKALAALDSARGYLRSKLGQRIKLRYIPELTFLADDTLDKAAHIEQVLYEIHAEERPQDDEERPRDDEERPRDDEEDDRD